MAEFESKIKHLEFIQLTIVRMNLNSFMIKGWLITLVAAMFVLAEKDANRVFLWIIPISSSILFWGMDALFLSTERRYRSLYDVIRIKGESEIDFSMDTTAYEGGRNKFFCCFFSITLILFYPIVMFSAICGVAFF